MSREAGRRRRRGLPIARSSCEALHTEGARRGAVYASAGLACWQKLKRKDTYDTYVCMRAHTHAHIRAHVKVHARACISASTWHISQPRFYHCTSRVDIFCRLIIAIGVQPAREHRVGSTVSFVVITIFSFFATENLTERLTC